VILCKANGFELVGPIRDIQTIAVGEKSENWPGYAGAFRRGRWRKLKGFARVRLIDGTIHLAEIHWYEAHGVRRKELKIKFLYWISYEKRNKQEIFLPSVSITKIPSLTRCRKTLPDYSR
jgi:hypothetical protein